MSETITRRSPVLDRLPSEPIDVITSQGMAFAVVVEAYEIEAAAKQKVALCDLSYHAKWGLKGSGAAAWLADAGVNVPEGNYATGPLNSDDSAAGELGEDGGLIIRLPGEEFFLESGVKGEFLAQLRERDLSAGDVFPVEHQEATLLLVGKEARGVLAFFRSSSQTELPIACGSTTATPPIFGIHCWRSSPS